MKIAAALFTLVFLSFLAAAQSAPQNPTSPNPLAREIFQQLIEINTTDSVGNVTTAAEAMAARLREAGFSGNDVIVDGPNDRKKNLVARIHGTGQRKPILFIGHLDVVEARREDWTTDPLNLLRRTAISTGAARTT
jgi:acetylornithine deacetylase/succinyl-diaminopimelate desuccinylase-like protein